MRWRCARSTAHGLLDFYAALRLSTAGARSWKPARRPVRPAASVRAALRRRSTTQPRAARAGARAPLRDRARLRARFDALARSACARAPTGGAGHRDRFARRMRARIVGISLRGAARRGRLRAAARTTTPARRSSCRCDEVLARLKPWLEDAARAKLGQNIKYDRHVFANHGIAVRGYAPRHHAAELRARGAQAARPGKPGRAPPGPQGPELRRPVRQGRATRSRSRRSTSTRAAEYSGEDSEMTLQVHQTLWPQLQPTPGCASSTNHRDAGAARCCTRIERHGVLIDARAAGAAEPRAGRAHGGAGAARRYALAGQPFNLGSPKQIGEILFGKLGLPVNKKTASGAPQHRRRGAGEAGRRLPAAGQDPRAPQPVQAQGHLHRQAAADGQPATPAACTPTTRRRWR